MPRDGNNDEGRQARDRQKEMHQMLLLSGILPLWISYTLPKPQKNITKKQNAPNETTKRPSIASNLYDEDDVNEIHISEDDGDVNAEDEIVIDG